MKIVVLSDTHIPVNALDIPEKVYRDIESADLLLHAGDIVSIDFLNKLQGVCPKLKAVWGNMDEAELRKILPQKQTIKVNKHTIGLIHCRGAPLGLLEQAQNEFSKEKPDIIIFGHSHKPLAIEKNGILFFNPGSPTDKIFTTVNSYGIIIINDTIETKIIEV
jgi:putative phosphoesterase